LAAIHQFDKTSEPYISEGTMNGKNFLEEFFKKKLIHFLEEYDKKRKVVFWRHFINDKTLFNG
jgi:hypothetical protein